MINLVVRGLLARPGTLLLGPVETGALWAGFADRDCTDPSGDPIVRLRPARRPLAPDASSRHAAWTTRVPSTLHRDLEDGRPDGAYYRYAFSTGLNFPDYPKLGVWKDSYIITTREFGPTDRSVRHRRVRPRAEQDDRRAIRRRGLSASSSKARTQGNARSPLVGDGLLPPDMDGKQKPNETRPRPDRRDAGRRRWTTGRPLDAVNIWNFDVHWNSDSGRFARRSRTQLPIDALRLDLPVRADVARDCLPQPGHHEPGAVPRHPLVPAAAHLAARLPELQATTRRWSPNQSVEALPGVAGIRWYEIRRDATALTPCTSRARTLRVTGFTAGWAAIAQGQEGQHGAGYSVERRARRRPLDLRVTAYDDCYCDFTYSMKPRTSVAGSVYASPSAVSIAAMYSSVQAGKS